MHSGGNHKGLLCSGRIQRGSVRQRRVRADLQPVLQSGSLDRGHVRHCEIKKCSNTIEIRSAGDIFLRRFGPETLKKLVGLGGTWMSLSILSNNMVPIGLLVHLMFGKYGLTYEYSLILGVCVSVA